MSGFLLTLHVIVSLLLIGVILLQPGSKGGGLGATFGGGGANSAFGAQGAAPFLSKLTYWLAGGFMITCLVIEILIVKENRSVLDRTAAAKAAPVKIAAPAPAPAPAPVSAPTQK
jgi:preprotein translocase subunit SecG